MTKENQDFVRIPGAVSYMKVYIGYFTMRNEFWSLFTSYLDHLANLLTYCLVQSLSHARISYHNNVPNNLSLSF